MTGLQIAVLVYLTLAVLTTVASVDKPRKPVTAGVATLALIINLMIAMAVILFGGN